MTAAQITKRLETIDELRSKAQEGERGEAYQELIDAVDQYASDLEVEMPEVSL